MADKKRALILSDFTDAGTGESYAKDDTPLIDAGAFENYRAAGLVGTPPATTAARTAANKPKARRKPSVAKAGADRDAGSISGTDGQSPAPDTGGSTA